MTQETMDDDECKHEVFLDFKCAECEKLLGDCKDVATVPLNYLHPGVNFNLVTSCVDRYRDRDLKWVLGKKKLHLILDLDNTLIHTIRTKNLTPEAKKILLGDDEMSKLKIFEDKGISRIVKLRPGATSFIKEVYGMFDLSIYTMAEQDYAYTIAEALVGDTEDNYRDVFDRIISREDCTTAKEKGLDIVMSHKQVVLIVDDKEDVWENSCKGNIIQIEPYSFFTYANIQNKINDPNLDETSMDDGLKRVLSTLRAVHKAFYEDNQDVEECMKKDVRQVLKRVRANEVFMEEKQEGKKRKRLEAEENRRFIERFCAPLKRYKTDTTLTPSAACLV